MQQKVENSSPIVLGEAQENMLGLLTSLPKCIFKITKVIKGTTDSLDLFMKLDHVSCVDSYDQLAKTLKSLVDTIMEDGSNMLVGIRRFMLNLKSANTPKLHGGLMTLQLLERSLQKLKALEN